MSRLVPIFRMAAGGRLGDGHQSVPWIHLNDMIAIIQTALHNGSLHGAVNAVAPEAATNREFTKALASALHRPAVVPVPGILLRIAMGKAASTLLGGQRAIPAKLLSHSFTFLFPTLRSALHNLLQDDMGCTISNAESIPTSSYLQKRRPTYELRQQLLIQAPINEVMEFFSKAENLGLLTPPNVDFAMRSPSPIEMRDGAEIEYTIRIGKIPIHWKTQIETWLPTQRFVDVQMKGPYRAWWHEHAFRAEGETTIMEDRVLYALPLGILGRLAHRLHVSRMLLDIFTYRTRAISLRFGPPQLGREVSKPTLKLSTPRPTAVGALH